MIRGILFDKDGTLFDFNATWRGVAETALARLAPNDPQKAREMALAAGYDPDRRSFVAGSALVAGAASEVAAIWAPFLPGRTRAELERQINALAAEAEGPELTPAAADLPGLLAGLGREAGRALGVATHDSEDAARAHLGAVGALDAFSFIAGYDSGWGLKPGPGMVHAFCDASGIEPSQVAMIGDSLHDLGAGRAARAGLVVGVLTGPADEAELSELADIVVPSIEALPGLLAERAAG
ncbi:HAD family hydrolase [Rhodovulum sp. DZ06]|uniref:HAD family hydrolase n=1 Tax=Rhodovulum sp. DZ06 TaxID=3425126 RepID=UPI003D345BAE